LIRIPISLVTLSSNNSQSEVYLINIFTTVVLDIVK
jgi:hypothetical protein